jgi:predicted nucleic acid-binding protein
MAAPDGQIAAIARSQAMDLATRNARDFRSCGLALIDPWG